MFLITGPYIYEMENKTYAMFINARIIDYKKYEDKYGFWICIEYKN